MKEKISTLLEQSPEVKKKQKVNKCDDHLEALQLQLLQEGPIHQHSETDRRIASCY